MKKILAISGSPRPRGNTYRIVKHVEKELKAMDNYEFKYLFLKEKNLEYCRGCLTCMKKGETHCPVHDDALSILQDLKDADGVIFLSPVYVHTVSALMKNFFDRFAFLCHRPPFLDKSALLITSTELSGIEETLDYMAFPVFTWGFQVADRLGIVYSSFAAGGEYTRKARKWIKNAAFRFHKALTTERHKPTLKELAFFNLLKTKIKLHKDLFPYEYQYWKKEGWLNSPYFRNVKIPVFKGFLARTMVGLRVKRIRHKLDLKSKDNALPRIQKEFRAI